MLADSHWNTTADSHILGGQLGVRYFRICNRLTVNLESRFMAGCNFQTIRQRGTLGTELSPPGELFEPLLMGPTSFTHAKFEEEFVPLAELRAELRYQLTRGVSVGAGWTGIWVDGIARPSNMVNYEVPDLGIVIDHNDQDVFIHGGNLSIIINR